MLHTPNGTELRADRLMYNNLEVDVDIAFFDAISHSPNQLSITSPEFISNVIVAWVCLPYIPE